MGKEKYDMHYDPLYFFNTVKKFAQDRKATQGKLDDCDFLCGALAALVAVGIPLDAAPASMILGPMFGQKIFEDEPVTKKEKHNG